MTQRMLTCRISSKRAVAQQGGPEKWESPHGFIPEQHAVLSSTNVMVSI